VVDTLVKQLFLRVGCPRAIVSDCSPEFVSELFQELCKRLEVTKLRMSFYHPRCNVYAERFQRTLNSMLAKIVGLHHRDWHE